MDHLRTVWKYHTQEDSVDEQWQTDMPEGHIQRWTCLSCSVRTDADIWMQYERHKLSAGEIWLTANIQRSGSKNSGSDSLEDGQWPRVTTISRPPATAYKSAKGILDIALWRYALPQLLNPSSMKILYRNWRSIAVIVKQHFHTKNYYSFLYEGVVRWSTSSRGYHQKLVPQR